MQYFGSAKFAGPANIFCASHLKFSDAVLFTNATYLEQCPRVCSHVVLGKRHGPRLPPSPYRIPDYAPHSSLKCWKVLDHGPHGFPRVRDRDQNAFPHVLARPTYFRPSILAGFRSTALCFPIAGFRRPRSKVWKVATLGFKKEITLLRQMDAKRPRHGGGGAAPPPRICNEGAHSKRASKAISQGNTCCVLEKISLLF